MQDSKIPKAPPRETAWRRFLRGKDATAPEPARLVLVIYALLLLSRLIDQAFLSREGEYLSTVLLQLLIFPIPAYVYIRLRSIRLQDKNYRAALRLRRVSLSHILFILAGILFLIAGCTLLAMLCGMLNSQTSFTLYDTFSSINDGTAGATVRLIFTYGLLPAFCEELVFRGILCAEYEEGGVLYAMTASSIFFAFLHFDLTALPVYLLAGVVLSFVRYVTRSTVASMLVHLGYNLFGVLAQAGLSGYCRSTGNLALLVVVLIALLLLSAALLCGETARILNRRATLRLTDAADEQDTPGLWRYSGGSTRGGGFRGVVASLGRIFRCPEAILAVVLWILGVVLNLVR